LEFDGDARFHGRVGAAMALHAVVRFLVALESDDPEEVMRERNAYRPIVALMGGLGDLDSGTVVPMLQGAPAPNRRMLPVGVSIERAIAAAAAECLVLSGLAPKAAAAHVAKQFSDRAGAPQSGKRALAVVIGEWRYEFRRGQGDETALAKFRGYVDQGQQVYRDLGPEAVRQYADAILADRTFSPFGKSPPRKPK
jgi:hypothetical protein